MVMSQLRREKTDRILDRVSLDATLGTAKAKIVVMIPALNEEKTIADVIKRITKVFEENSYRYEIVVIDDGSTDKTSRIAREAGGDVVEHFWNRGLAEAMKTGLGEALRRNANIVVNIDADGQYRPEEIPRLVEPILDGKADMVLGSRFTGNIEYMPLIKWLGNRFFTWLLVIVTGFPFTDTQTGFRALTSDAARRIVIHSRYTYTQEMLIHATEAGLRIVEVPILFGKRRHGNSRLIFNPLSYGLRVLPIIFHTFRDYHPSMLRARMFGFLADILIMLQEKIEG
jgi:glycosyltransferase involved in cell wall biosynthesis